MERNKLNGFHWFSKKKFNRTDMKLASGLITDGKRGFFAVSELPNYHFQIMEADLNTGEVTVYDSKSFVGRIQVLRKMHGLV